jgi:hypothetical protein
MEHDEFNPVNQCIQEAARQAAATDGLLVPVIERFLSTGEETWEAAGSGCFSPAQFQQDEVYRRARKPPSGPCLGCWLVCFRQKSNWSRGWLQKRFGGASIRW